ncbi:hypothetical protein Tco_0604067 [Tanacetum coccineum]
MSSFKLQNACLFANLHQGLIEATKEVMPLAEHRQFAKHIYANFRKKFTGVLYKNLFWKAAKASYPAKFQEVMNQIKDLNARKKPILNMLEDIRVYIMERQKRMMDKSIMWNDEICPNIRKKVEIIKDKHTDWRVIPSGGSKFEVRNGYEAFKVDEMNMACSCRKGCKLGVPVQIGDAGNAGTQVVKAGVGRTKNMVRRGGSSVGMGSSSYGVDAHFCDF